MSLPPSTKSTASPVDQLSLEASTWQRLRFVWQLLQRKRVSMLALIGFEIFFALLSAVIPYFTKLQIDQLSGANPQIFGLTGVPMFMLLLAVPAGLELVRLVVFDSLRRWVEERFRHDLRRALDLLIWERMRTFDAAFFQNPQNQPIIQSAQSSASAVTGYFFFFLDQLRSVVTVLAILPLLGNISWPLLLVVLVSALILMVVTQWSRQAHIVQGIETQELADRQRRVHWALEDNFVTLRQFAAIDRLVKESEAMQDERLRLEQRQYQRERFFHNLEWTCEQFFTLGITLFVGLQVFSGAMSVGTFTLTISYVRQLHSLFQNLLTGLNRWFELNLNFTAIQFFFSLKSRLKVGERRVSELTVPVQLKMEGVSFAYPALWQDEQKFLEFRVEQLEKMMKKTGYSWYSHELKRWKRVLQRSTEEVEVLHDISLTLETGHLTALLGRNGAGKTTMTQLLFHDFEPTAGQVTLNGVPLFEYDQHFLMQQYALLQQRPFIMPEYSVRENLTLSVIEPVTDEQIWEILEELEAADFVRDLPNGLDTRIGRDTRFSGGQEQLLAVARVLIAPRPVIIFDEGSSQLDVEKEVMVLKALRRRLPTSAILFITHRVSVARKADTIVMIDAGKIVEEGRHDALLKKNGLYAHFWNLQVVE